MRHQNQLTAKGNTQGRHYMPKSPSRAAQPFDPTRTALRKIAKITPELLKLARLKRMVVHMVKSILVRDRRPSRAKAHAG
jgi:hypothetical protein